jgi:hypothetical protein
MDLSCSFWDPATFDKMRPEDRYASIYAFGGTIINLLHILLFGRVKKSPFWVCSLESTLTQAPFLCNSRVAIHEAMEQQTISM